MGLRYTQLLARMTCDSISESSKERISTSSNKMPGSISSINDGIHNNHNSQ